MTLSFDDFELDVDKFELRHNGQAEHVEPMVFDLLVLLANNPGRVITRDELIEKLWDGRIVSEATISTTIKSARKALGDSGEIQKYIKTIRGRGIEFIADVNTAFVEKRKSSNERTPVINQKSNIPKTFIFKIAVIIGLLLFAIFLYVTDDGRQTNKAQNDIAINPEGPYKVAVMPFADMSENADQEYFADGMAEEILNLLASTPGLELTSRTTAFSLKGLNLTVPEIADRLNVHYIVEGSIRTTGDRVRVTAQLIDVFTDAHLWSDTYDRELTSIFDVQDDISGAITDALKIELGANARSRRAPTTNMAAYDLYLRGHQLFQNRGTFRGSERVVFLEEAISHLKQATELDPNYAEAWADLAGVSMVIPTFDGVNYSFDEMAELSYEYVDRALSINPNLSQAWGAKGFTHIVQLEFADAVSSLKRATELNPFNETAWLWLGLTYTTFGGDIEAIEAINRAIQLNPSIPVNYNVIGAAAHGGGDVEKAAEYQQIAVFERGFELGRIDTMLIAIDENYNDPRGRQEAALEDAIRYINFLEKDRDPARDEKLALYVDARFEPVLREQALAQLDLDIENRERVSFIGAYLLGDGTRMAKHFVLGTENNGLNLRRVFSPVGRPLFKHKPFRDYLISIGMLDYWKDNRFPHLCILSGDNDFICE